MKPRIKSLLCIHPSALSLSLSTSVSYIEDVYEISTISVNMCMKSIKGFESREVFRGAHRVAAQWQAMRISSADTTVVLASSFCSSLPVAGTPDTELGPAAISFMAAFPISFA
jgi:hypothetical protein